MATRRPRAAPTGAPAPDLLDAAAPPPADPPAPGPASRVHLDPEGEAVHIDVPAHQQAKPPAKLSKLSAALAVIDKHVLEMNGLDAQIAEVEQNYPATHKFAVATKEGYRLADSVRKDARKSRLHVADMRKQGTDLLNTLKNEVWAAADPAIARLQAIEDNAKAQVEAQDKIESDRKKRHEDAILAIGALALNMPAASAEIAQRQASLAAIIVDDSYEEFREQAVKRHAEVAGVLADAHAAAVKRELETAAQAKRDAQDKAARERIAHYKSLAAGAEGTDLENVRALTRSIDSKPDDSEETYGGLAEFVDMARQKAISELNLLARGLEHDAEEAARGPFFWSHPESSDFGRVDTRAELEELMGSDPNCMEVDEDEFRRLVEAKSKHAADDGPEVLAPQDGENSLEAPEAGLLSNLPHDEPPVDEDPFSVEAMQRKARANVPPLSTPAPTAAPAPRTVSRMAIPSARPVATPAPTQAPAIATAVAAADVYTVARRVRAAYVILNDAEVAALPPTLRAALNELVRAVHTTA